MAGDRQVEVNNILLNKLLPILEKLSVGDISVQTNDESRRTLRQLLNIAAKKYEDDTEIIFFTYPNDGTRTTITAGNTTLNYRHGTIKAADGTTTKMSSSLADQKKGFLRSMAIVADQDVIIQLDARDKSPVRADVLTGYTYNQFEELTITATKNTEVAVFACTNPKHSYVYSSESTVSVGKSSIQFIDTDKDSHFTTAIAQNAIETENITGLTSSKITITGISMQADEAKNYRLWIFGSDAHTDTDLDVDEFVDFVNFDLGTNGVQVAGANQYYFAQTGLGIAYEDEDSSGELHLALQNLDAGAKTAGAAGEVKVKVFYTPRL